MYTITKKRGFTLVELLVYAAGFTLLLGAMMSLIVSIYGWYTTATVVPRIDRLSTDITNLIVEDIRSGQYISYDSFATTSGSVTLSALIGSTSVARTIALNNGRITYRENGGLVQYLSPKDVVISRFYLKNINTPNSLAIHFDMDVTYSVRGISQTRTYSGVSILRNSYQ